MLNWIEIAALYSVGLGFFLWLGGISAAADAISRWGRSTAERHPAAVSSSS